MSNLRTYTILINNIQFTDRGVFLSIYPVQTKLSRNKVVFVSVFEAARAIDNQTNMKKKKLNKK